MPESAEEEEPPLSHDDIGLELDQVWHLPSVRQSIAAARRIRARALRRTQRRPAAIHAWPPPPPVSPPPSNMSEVALSATHPDSDPDSDRIAQTRQEGPAL